MKCIKCKKHFPVEAVKHISECIWCGGHITHDPVDFLKHKSLNVISEQRPRQIEFANKVDFVLRSDNATFFCQGGCGVGKTYAYVIPSILSNRRTLISTGKKNLQDQLINIDIPQLLEKVNPKASVACLKGKNTYLCPLELDFNQPLFAQEKKLEQYYSIKEWLEENPLGDCNAFGLREWDYPANACTANECIGTTKCMKKETCGYAVHRKEALEAQHLITNHSLLGFGLRYGMQFILGHRDTLIMDEAQHCANDFKLAYTVHVTRKWAKRFIGSFNQTIKRNQTLLGDQKSLETDSFAAGYADSLKSKNEQNDLLNFITCWENTFDHITQGLRVKQLSCDNGFPAGFLGSTYAPLMLAFDQLRYTFAEYITDRWPRITEHALEEARRRTGGRNVSVEHVSYELLYDTAMKINTGPTTKHVLSHLDKKFRRLVEIHDMLAATATYDPKWLYTMSHQRWTNPKLTREPVDISEELGQTLGQVPRKVLCSATLLPEIIEEKLGIKQTMPFLNIPTGFNYRDNAKLYIPRDTPYPVSAKQAEASLEDSELKSLEFLLDVPYATAETDPSFYKYCEELAAHIVQLCRISKGNALTLFTAKGVCETVNHIIEKDYQFEYPIKGQLEGTSAVVAFKEYMQTNDSILFGLKSFFEGVDIKGDKLRLVIITKLPFPREDALIKREKELYNEKIREENERTKQLRALGFPAYYPKSYFTKYAREYMIIDFLQAVGRLLRTMTDKGVVAVLDPRIWTGGVRINDVATTSPFQLSKDLWIKGAYKGYGYEAAKRTPFPKDVWTSKLSNVQTFFTNMGV